MTVTSTFKQAFYNQQTSEVLLALCEIDHDDMDDPIRVVNDMKPVTHSGDIYTPFPFELTLPKLDGESPPYARIEICNVDRQIVQAIRSIDSAPDVTIKLILASDPDTIEVGPYSFTLEDVYYDSLIVSGSLKHDNIMDEPWTGDRFTPGTNPGLF